MYIRNELTVQHSLDAMKRHTCARSEDRKFKKKQSFPHITLSVEWFIFKKKRSDFYACEMGTFCNIEYTQN